MKKRSNDFLSEKYINHESEIFDYIGELQDYLWEFIRIYCPTADGVLDDWIDKALKNFKEGQLFVDLSRISYENIIYNT